MSITIEPHPLLETIVLSTEWPGPLGEIATLTDLDVWFSDGANPPLSRPDEVKPIVRDLLRFGGFKPTGRSKPASEYLLSALAKERLGTINAAVDACNVASLYSGLPISVVDADLGRGSWRIALADKGMSYVFNPTGQIIDIGGLVVLWDEEGPCGGPVKDSQRTKTHPETRTTLSVVWGTRDLPGRTVQTAAFYTELIESLGGVVTTVTPTAPSDHLE
jgi:DNA/RNA-binding domain of Phe-tRNA-synthetase-like protein